MQSKSMLSLRTIEQDLLHFIFQLGQFLHLVFLGLTSFVPYFAIETDELEPQPGCPIDDDPESIIERLNDELASRAQRIHHLEVAHRESKTDLRNTIIALCEQVSKSRKVEDHLGHRNKILDVLLTQRMAQLEGKDEQIHELQNKLVQAAECLSSVLRANTRLVACLEETNKRVVEVQQEKREWRRDVQQALVVLEARINEDSGQAPGARRVEKTRGSRNHRWGEAGLVCRTGDTWL